MARLGKNQLALLKVLANPNMFLIVESKESRSLAKRGLIRSRTEDGNSFFQITPAGWRALADAVDAGILELPAPASKESGE